MISEGAYLEFIAELAVLVINDELKFGHPTPEQRYKVACEAIENMNARINKKYTPIPEDWHKDERNWV